MTSGRVFPLGSLTCRLRALTIPSVTLDWSPSGLPIARTTSPTCSLEESPKTAGVRPEALILTTATSSGVYEPTSVPVYDLPLESVTLKVVEVPTTWALVTMSPLLSYMTPEPRPASVSISTTSGFTFLITSTICAWTVKASSASLPEGEAVGDGVEVDGVEVDGVEVDGDAVVPAASEADGCAFTVWRPTRAATLDEPDVPQAIATKAIKTRDMT